MMKFSRITDIACVLLVGNIVNPLHQKPTFLDPRDGGFGVPEMKMLQILYKCVKKIYVGFRFLLCGLLELAQSWLASGIVDCVFNIV